MHNLPQHITSALSSKSTSLGDSPALPPSENFIESVISAWYATLNDGLDDKDTNVVISELNKLVNECRDEERKNRPALEKLCSDIVSDMFEIPEDTVRIDISLTDTVDMAGYRMLPEEEEDFSFDDITDMQNLGGEIKKRRMLNALVEGASESVGYDIGSYVQELFNINPALPAMYAKIIKYSQWLMYAVDETSLEKANDNSGSVKVIMKSAPEMMEIEVKATLFPILLQSTVKGVLELSILQGLPDDKDKAYYVMKKSDYRMAEVWDSRMGVPLWKRIEKVLPDQHVGLNFLFMELSMLPVSLFNEVMQEAFVGTKKGHEILAEICNEISQRKDEEDFNDYISKNNELYPIEDGFFTEDELVGEQPFGY